MGWLNTTTLSEWVTPPTFTTCLAYHSEALKYAAFCDTGDVNRIIQRKLTFYCHRVEAHSSTRI